jgi:sugar phosphate isomerase/epimerase
MPKLAVFPKVFMQALCKDGTISVTEWIELAVKLDIDGLEWYAGFLEMQDESNWKQLRDHVESYGKSIPIMCCSPNFYVS